MLVYSEEQFKEVKKHSNHKIAIAVYDDEEISIECMTCYEVIVTFKNEDLDE